MKALELRELGDPDVLTWREIPDPEPGPGELLVRVRAFAINWADIMQRQGVYPGGPEPPFVIGHELSGEVVGRGPDTDGPPDGTRVFGVLGRPGSAAELAIGRADLLHAVPDGVGDVEAAAIASPFFTADVAINEYGRLAEGETVLIHAAAGGYGSAAVQLCRHYGAGTIICTAGADEKLEHVKEWGGDVLVNYTTDDFVPVVEEVTDGRGVDLVLESVGGDVLGRSFDCLAPFGRLVTVGASSGETSKRFRIQTLFETNVSVAGFTLGTLMLDHVEIVRPAFGRVIDAIASGAVRPIIAKVFPAEEVAEAHRFLGDRKSIGRTVVTLEDGP